MKTIFSHYKKGTLNGETVYRVWFKEVADDGFTSYPKYKDYTPDEFKQLPKVGEEIKL